MRPRPLTKACCGAFTRCSGLDYVALRYFNVYGPRMDIHGAYTEVLIRWMERIEAGLPPLILGDGTQTMDFVFTEDIARANLMAASPRQPTMSSISATGPRPAWASLPRRCSEPWAPSRPLEFGPPRGVNAVTRRLADISRAHQGLGWKPEVDLEEGLRRLVDWWRAERLRGRRGG